MGVLPPATDSGGQELKSYLRTIVGAIILSALIMTFLGRAFTVEGPSMLPTLQTGERLVVDKLSYRLHAPSRGDVVVFRFPGDTSQYFIKRIVGLPGDRVEVTGGVVYINGERLEEDYVLGPAHDAFGPRQVPKGHYFVLGDNRNNSEDSRSARVGFVPMKHIIGKATLRYWPLNRVSSLAGTPIVYANP